MDKNDDGMLEMQPDMVSVERVVSVEQLEESLRAAGVHDSSSPPVQPLIVRPETLTGVFEAADRRTFVTCVFKILSRRASKRTSFFDAAIFCNETSSAPEVHPSKWPVVQLILQLDIVGAECYDNVIYPSRLGDHLAVTGQWVLDETKRIQLNFVGSSASVVSKHTGKGFVAYRVFTPGEREPQKKEPADGSAVKCTAAKMRAGLVGDWLVSTFGMDLLTSGIVLDVAGGAGYLAHVLCAKGIHVTIVDPRVQRHANKGERKRSRRHGNPLPEHIESKFDDEFLSNPAHQALLDRVSLVVALHADGATEPAVQFATSRGLSVAAVPCCVFPSLFPTRRLPSGKFVKERADFISYLCSTYELKSEEFEKVGGANVVCWRKRAPEAGALAHGHVGIAGAGCSTDGSVPQSDPDRGEKSLEGVERTCPICACRFVRGKDEDMEDAEGDDATKRRRAGGDMRGQSGREGGSAGVCPACSGAESKR